ncbi:MAG: transglycosylase SLT domain-containing protein [Candidatus Eremiobacteraeota bacterium]|nr:transglycosylase SLT domain-containing protein [Candidatus Eremiobacteraeota bacterium]
MLPLALLAMAGLMAAAVKLTGGPNAARVAANLGWPVTYIQYAVQAARKYGVPWQWVLATIIVESSGNPRAAGDADGRSVGLMQVNVVANNLPRESLFDPKTNIDWGTKLMAQFVAQIRGALGGRTPPIPLDEIMRLSYKGPATVLAALRRGENPAAISWAPTALQNWRAAMARVQAASGKGAIA